MNEPLLRFVTWWAVSVIGSLRRRRDRIIIPILRNPDFQTVDHICRLFAELMRGEARLWREITEAAARELGLALPRRKLVAYARSAPSSKAELRARLSAYDKMLANPERYVRRLVARLRIAMGLSMLHAGRATIRVAILPIASILPTASASRAVAPAHPAAHPP